MIYPDRYSKIVFTWRYLTARFRAQPSFMIIGAMKAGTTSLANYLMQHPQIGKAIQKEIRFFQMNQVWQLGSKWYRAHFPLAMISRNQQCFDASVVYLNQPIVPLRVHRDYPRMKFIVLLRNPIDRAYSHYHNMVRSGKEQRSFEQVIEEFIHVELNVREELENFDFRNNDNSRLIYNNLLYRGKYAAQLSQWFRYFERNQFLIIQSEYFYAHTREAMINISQFLGLSDWELTNFDNRNTGGYPSMNSQTRQQLLDYYKPYNEQLYALLGQDYGWT